MSRLVFAVTSWRGRKRACGYPPHFELVLSDELVAEVVRMILWSTGADMQVSRFRAGHSKFLVRWGGKVTETPVVLPR